VAFAVASARLIASVQDGLLGVTDRLRRVLSQTCFVEDAVTKARWAALAASGQVDDPCRYYLLGWTIVLQFQDLAYVIECNRHGFNIVRFKHAISEKYAIPQKWKDRGHGSLLSR
jgi:hypothetical protein